MSIPKSGAETWKICRFYCRSGKPCIPNDQAFRCRRCLEKNRLCKEPVHVPPTLRPDFWLKMIDASLTNQEIADSINVWNATKLFACRVAYHTSASKESTTSPAVADKVDDFTTRLQDLETSSNSEGDLAAVAVSVARAIGLIPQPPTWRDSLTYDAKEILVRIEV